MRSPCESCTLISSSDLCFNYYEIWGSLEEYLNVIILDIEEKNLKIISDWLEVT